MPYIEESVAAATAVVDYNIAGGKWWQQSNRARKIKKAALVGSTAVADTKVLISFGARRVMTLYNSTAGAAKVPVETDFKEMSDLAICPPGVPINIEVTDAADTNAIVLGIDIMELPKRRNYRRRY